MKILIVDDHPLIREGLANVLRELDNDLTVIEAESGDEALAALEREQGISLVLLDLVLPGADGLSLLTQVREDRPEVPVVVLSGKDSPQIVRQAIDSGAMGFITKRSATSVLVSALRLVLSGAVYIPPQALAASDTPPLDPDMGRTARRHRPPSDSRRPRSDGAAGGSAGPHGPGQAQQSHLPRSRPRRGNRQDAYHRDPARAQRDRAAPRPCSRSASSACSCPSTFVRVPRRGPIPIPAEAARPAGAGQ
ncbi:MAG: response regulator [Comamonadaceae bacterium]|nr:response regulator [Comamonadaceae bacterium]